MILPDTSIWIEHVDRGNPVLAMQLAADTILGHPYVIGELALGNLRRRAAVLADLSRLRQPVLASHSEVMDLIERHALNGLGIGYVDTHLLASTLLTPGISLWTRDKRLYAIAKRMNLSWTDQ